MKRESEKKVIKTKEEKKKELGSFIKTHVLKNTNVLTIIGILLFLLVISVFISASDDVSSELEIIEKTSLLNDIKEMVSEEDKQNNLNDMIKLALESI